MAFVQNFRGNTLFSKAEQCSLKVCINSSTFLRLILKSYEKYTENNSRVLGNDTPVQCFIYTQGVKIYSGVKECIYDH